MLQLPLLAAPLHRRQEPFGVVWRHARAALTHVVKGSDAVEVRERHSVLPEDLTELRVHWVGAVAFVRNGARDLAGEELHLVGVKRHPLTAVEVGIEQPTGAPNLANEDIADLRRATTTSSSAACRIRERVGPAVLLRDRQ